MTENRAYKQRIRNRMRLTGETYTTAKKKLARTPDYTAPNKRPVTPMDVLFRDEDIHKIREGLTTPGLTLISGLAGTGKTETLKSVLSYASNDLGLRSSLVQNCPEIEYVPADDTQLTSLLPNEEVDGPDLVKYLLRLHANVIGYGELRQSKEAEALLSVSQLSSVVTTVHGSTRGVWDDRRALLLDETHGYPPALKWYYLLADDLDSIDYVNTVIEQTLIYDPHSGDVAGKLPLTNVVTVTPELRSLLKSGNDEQLADYFAEPTQWDLGARLWNLVREGRIQPTSRPGRYMMVD